jgi:hypothetical protein
MVVQIQLRRDTAANWTAQNPTLAAGEMGIETDTGQVKIGDGVTAWTSLGYFSAGGSGHVIKENGSVLTARANLDFTEGLLAVDATPDTDVKADWATIEIVDVAATEDPGADTKIPRGGHRHAHGSGYAGGHSDHPTLVHDHAGHALLPESIEITGGPFALRGDLTPSQLLANVNDYNPAGLADATILRLAGDAARDITGIAGGADGRQLLLVNIGAFNITLQNQDVASAAANRFLGIADLVLAPSAMVLIVYDSSESRWRIVQALPLYASNPEAIAAAAVIGSSLQAAPGNHVHAHGTGYLPNAHHNEVHDHSGTDLNPDDLDVAGLLYLTGIVSATTTGQVNALSVAGSVYRWSGTGLIDIRGVAGGVDGRVLHFINQGDGNSLALRNEDAAASAADRIHTADGSTFYVELGDVGTLIYDAVLSRWLPMERNSTQSGFIGTPFYLTADITATATGTQNDWNPTGMSNAAVVRWNGTTRLRLTGITGGFDGRILILQNVRANVVDGTILIKHDSGESSAANRFKCPSQSDIEIGPGESVILQYDPVDSKWRVATRSIWTQVKRSNLNIRSNTTTTTADEELQVPLAASTFYYLRGRIFYRTDATPDFKYQFTWPASPNEILLRIKDTVGGGTTETTRILVTGTQADVSLLAVASDLGYIDFECYIETAGTSGIFAFEWSQNTSSANQTIVFPHSYIEYMMAGTG